MKTVAIIQARLNSTRLPGKVLLPLAGKPMLWHVIERAKRAKMVDDVALAYPWRETGYETFIDVAYECLSGNQIHSFCGQENDLIGRFNHVAKIMDADIVVRLTADNPFVAPSEINRAVCYFLEQPRIFVSNMHQHAKAAMDSSQSYSIGDAIIGVNGYPDGIGCEVFSMSTLKWMHEYIKDPESREHPHKYFHYHGMVESPECPKEFARPDLKLDVNDQIGYEFVKDIYDNLYPQNPQFYITDVIEYLDKKKCLAE